MHRQRNGNDGKHREHHRIGLRKDFFLFPNPDTETVVVGRSLGVFVSRWNNNDMVHTQGRKQMTSLMQTNIQRSRRRQHACVRACVTTTHLLHCGNRGTETSTRFPDPRSIRYRRAGTRTSRPTAPWVQPPGSVQQLEVEGETPAVEQRLVWRCGRSG